MTELTLTKHHALGNDFLVTFHPGVEDVGALAVRLCDRRRGVGADGLLIGESEPGHAARMVLFNADGSPAEMSGNGIRCFAHALAARRGNFDEQLILTDAGPRLVQFEADSTIRSATAGVSMGEITTVPAPSGWAALGVNEHRPVMHLSTGNPHSVVGVDDVSMVDLLALGQQLPHVNLEVIEPGPGPAEITMRVHERGAGLTQACGTGACASAWAASSWGFVSGTATEIIVHMPGGAVTVRLNDPAPRHVTLVGPAVRVGSITVVL